MNSCFRVIEEVVLKNENPWNNLGRVRSIRDFAEIGVDEKIASCLTRLLTKPDSRFWAPYMILKTNSPSALSKRLPQWREPRECRLAAIRWLSDNEYFEEKGCSLAMAKAATSDPD